MFLIYQYHLNSRKSKTKLKSDFEGLGLKIHDFYINSISVPEEVQKIIDQKSGMEAVGNIDKFMKYKLALSLENASLNQSSTGDSMGGGIGAGLGLGMGFMMPQILQQSFNPVSNSEKKLSDETIKFPSELIADLTFDSSTFKNSDLINMEFIIPFTAPSIPISFAL